MLAVRIFLGGAVVGAGGSAAVDAAKIFFGNVNIAFANGAACRQIDHLIKYYSEVNGTPGFQPNSSDKEVGPVAGAEINYFIAGKEVAHGVTDNKGDLKTDFHQNCGPSDSKTQEIDFQVKVGNQVDSDKTTVDKNQGRPLTTYLSRVDEKPAAPTNAPVDRDNIAAAVAINTVNVNVAEATGKEKETPQPSPTVPPGAGSKIEQPKPAATKGEIDWKKTLILGGIIGGVAALIIGGLLAARRRGRRNPPAQPVQPEAVPTEQPHPSVERAADGHPSTAKVFQEWEVTAKKRRIEIDGGDIEIGQPSQPTHPPEGA